MKKTWKILLITLGCFSALLASGATYFAVVTKDAALDPKKLVLSDDKVEIFDADDGIVKNASAFSRAKLFGWKPFPTKRNSHLSIPRTNAFTTTAASTTNAW